MTYIGLLEEEFPADEVVSKGGRVHGFAETKMKSMVCQMLISVWLFGDEGSQGQASTK